MTSLRFMFIQLSQLTRWPLYVSPFFSSTNCKEKNASTGVISAYDKVCPIQSTSVSTKCTKTIVTDLHVTIPSANIFLDIYKLEHECTQLFTKFLCKLDLNSQISRKQYVLIKGHQFANASRIKKTRTKCNVQSNTTAL